MSEPSGATLCPTSRAGEAVVARGAALGQRGDRRVGGRRGVGRGLVGLVAPAGVDPVGRPGSAREEAGRRCSSRHRVRSARWPGARAAAGAGASRTPRSPPSRRSRRRPGCRGLLGIEAGRARGAGGARAGRAAGAARRAARRRLAAICSQQHRDRATHAYGKSYLDIVRGFRGVYEHVPDVVARPRDERDVEALLEWAAGRERRGRSRTAAGPAWSAASSRGSRRRFNGALSLDLGALDALLELDEVSRAARIGAGASGPRVEELLGAHGLTLRFFPQSFELSTLGGWIATRAGGHFATKLHAHRRPRRERPRDHAQPGSGSRGGCPARAPGPSPDRMLLGSEGALGVITSAWVRVQPRPEHRASRAVRFDDVPARRRGGPRALAGRPGPVELPPDR